MHERAHWLQFIGTPVGLCTAFLADIQTSLLADWHTSRDGEISCKDLPLIESDAMTNWHRDIWLGIEHLQLCMLGGSVELSNRFTGIGVQASAVSRLARIAASVALGEADAYEAYQDRVWCDDIFSKSSSLVHLEVDGVALGATHLMETTARVNELVRLAMFQPSGSIVWDGYFNRPYSYARDVFYSITKADTSAGLDFALCILADWALCLPLPPTLPLITPLDTIDTFPGPLFAWLTSRLDVSLIDDGIHFGDAQWADQQALSIYRQIQGDTEFWTPLDIATSMREMYSAIGSVDLQTALFAEAVDDDELPEPSDGAGRIRFVMKRAYDAAGVRLERPSYFAMPGLVYIRDRDEFHAVFDQLRPPLMSIGENRWAPLEHDTRSWYLYFMLAAIEHDVATNAAIATCAEAADALAARYAYVGDVDAGYELARQLVEMGLEAILGQGSATDAILSGFDDARRRR